MTPIDETLRGLWQQAGSVPFKPVAWYHAALDFLLFLSEDCSYGADRVDEQLTLLRHPNQPRVVGFKLKGFEYLFNEVKGRLGLEEDDFSLLVATVELALVKGPVEELTAEWGAGTRGNAFDRLVKYVQARNLVVAGHDSREGIKLQLEPLSR